MNKVTIDRALIEQAVESMRLCVEESGFPETMQKEIDAMEKALAEPAERKHITDGPACWCNPETVYTDPDTGTSVIVHKEPQ